MHSRRCRSVALAVLLLLASTGLSQQRSHALRTRQSIDAAAISSIVTTGIREGRLPGAVVLIGHGGRVVFRHAYGERSVEPGPREVMTATTIFDMASLTKTLVTATAIMQLFEQGRLRLDEPVASYLPAFAAHGKEDITIRQLLTHYSGLPADLELKEPWHGKEEGYRRAMDTAPMRAAGVEFHYSDVNFIVLGAVVEKLSGMPLEQYAAKYIVRPLGLKHTGYLPAAIDDGAIAPTQYDEQHVMLRGTVHDPTARRMGGVAGHAGLFSTADDVSVFAQNLLDRLAGRPSRFPLKQATLLKMSTPNSPATGVALRGLGWDIESPFSSNRGELFPVGSFGHTGFTGTSLWMDPSSNTYVIVLANAVHPNGPKSITAMRAEIANVAAASFKIKPDDGGLSARLTGYNESLTGMRRWPARNAQVENGIDVLEASHFQPLAQLAATHKDGLRIGLLTNQTGLDRSGRRTIDILAHDAAALVPGLQLTTLFSPEHGINGAVDEEGIADSLDHATGLPVVSLYGAKDEQRRPKLETMRGLNAVIIDLQDAGSRFYTYEALVRYFLEAAAKTDTAVILLDRPDPLGGSFVQGPLSDPGTESYVNVAPIPVRHGMTLGELAAWMNAKLGLHASLSVIAMKGWQRGDWFDSTGLTWVNPSPNLRSLNEATLYPGIGLIETTNLSVGRGTATPFEQIGAPWIDGRTLAQQLNRRDLPGVRFVPVKFTPEKPYPYAGELCGGVNVLVTERNSVDSPELGLEIAAALQKLYPQHFKLAGISRLLANKAVLDDLSAGRDPQRIEEDWQQPLHTFVEQRKPFLLY